MVKKILCVALVLATLLTVMPLTAYAAVGDHQYDESENNDGAENAKTIYHDYTIVGNVNDDDIDTFAFYVSETSVVTYIAVCENSYMYSCFVDDYSGEIISVTAPYYEDGYYYMILQETLTTGWYYLLLLNSERYRYNDYLFYITIEPTTPQHYHSFHLWVEQAPTCTEQGYKEMGCNCGYSYLEYTQPLGHRYTGDAYPCDEYTHERYCIGSDNCSCSSYITEVHRDLNEDGVCDGCAITEVYFPLEGWHETEEGKWVFYVAGEIAKNCWRVDPEGSWCYLGEDGFCVTNCWKQDSHGWCYLDSDGRMVTDKWVMDSVGWCYVGADGYCVTNCWKKDSHGWCYLDGDGRMATNKWVRDSVGWCYVGADGYCVTNCWKQDSKGWCYLDGDGRMVTNKWVMDSKGWCYVGADGYAVTNCWKRDSVGWCYLDENGSMTKSEWVYDDGHWYYLNANGYMVTGRQTIGGKVYYFNASGVLAG